MGEGLGHRGGAKRRPYPVQWGENGAERGIVVVKNTKEWLESRKKLKERKERKKRAAGDSRASEEPAAFGFPIGTIKEQVAQGRRAAAQRFKG